MANSLRIEIFGAGSIVTPYLTQRLALKNAGGVCLSRTPPPENSHLDPAFSWQRFDAELPGDWCPHQNAIIISLMPLWLLPPLLPRLMSCRQLIVFSSTSVFSKSVSQDPQERLLANRLARAEQEIMKYCNAKEIPWTILRPTLIYDGKRDKNITAIAHFIRRWGFFPIAYPGKGLRQPVHADDLAAATVATIENAKAINRDFNLTGGETLTYRAMVERIFNKVERRKFMVSMPAIIPELVLKTVRMVRSSMYSPQMFRRMNQHLVFDSSEACMDLGYSPRSFCPEFVREE